MKPQILVIEQESGSTVVIDYLTQAGYVVEQESDGDTALGLATGNRYDAILLDSTPPRRGCVEICRELRVAGVDAAVLVFTARGQVMTRIEALKQGADDCLTKPFEPAELLARVEALLRRTMKGKCLPPSVFQFGGVEIDFARSEVMREGRQVKLAGKELELLRYLIRNQERVVPREELMRRVWDYASDTSSRTIDTHVVWLRHKLEADPQTPRHIQTVRGRGYRFMP